MRRTRAALRPWLFLGVPMAGFAVALGAQLYTALAMPGSSHSGALPPVTPNERALAAELERDVTTLAGDIGERNMEHPDALEHAARYIEDQFTAAGYAVERELYPVRGASAANLVAERASPSRDDVLVVGAHYDSVNGSRGANDNASGVASLLALARRIPPASLPRRVRFVAFVNEEPPYFHTPTMGSLVNARRARARGDRIAGMVCLETLGYYSDATDSQDYPFPLSVWFPSRGNFVAFVGDSDSRDLVTRSIALFRATAQFPSEGAALSSSTTGVSWSDHWSYWQIGVPAVMVTDTAILRYPEYHTARDDLARVDYPRLARVVEGLVSVVRGLAR